MSSDAVLPCAVSVFQDLLSSDALSPITPTDVAIFNTPEGELFAKGMRLRSLFGVTNFRYNLVETDEYVPKIREEKVQKQVHKERKKRGERGMMLENEGTSL